MYNRKNSIIVHGLDSRGKYMGFDFLRKIFAVEGKKKRISERSKKRKKIATEINRAKFFISSLRNEIYYLYINARG